MEEIPLRWKQPKREDKPKMKNEAKLLRCTLLNGSAWSRKYMRKYKGKHRLRKEEMEEQLNKKAKEGWRFALGEARITDEPAGSEDRK